MKGCESCGWAKVDSLSQGVVKTRPQIDAIWVHLQHTSTGNGGGNGLLCAHPLLTQINYHANVTNYYLAARLLAEITFQHRPPPPPVALLARLSTSVHLKMVPGST